MAQQSKKNSPVGRGQEEQLPSILASVQGTEANSEASSGVGSPIEERQYIRRPEQASTPHDIGELAGEMESPAPTCKPGYDEGTIRTCEKEPLIDSEGKVSVPETGEDQGLPRWLTYPKEGPFKLKVTEECKDIFKQFPKALGLIVLFACSVAASRKLPSVPGVVKGVDKMEDTFRYLGYAVLRLPVNLASWQYRAAMKAVASVSFPESYRHMFVYFTGHGGKDSIYTPDGHLELEDITNPFSPKKASQLTDLTKIFIFDACSSLSKLTSMYPNSLLLFPAHPGYSAFAKGDDCGLLTQHLAPALRTSSKSFNEIIIDVTREITDEIDDNSEWSDRVPLESQPLLCQTLKAHVSLLKERSDAMTPSLEIQKVLPTSISAVISSPPRAVQFEIQHLHLFYKSEGAEQRIPMKGEAALGGTVVIDNLLPGKHYVLKAVAVYPKEYSEAKEISSQEVSCDMPTEVQPVLNQDLDYCHVDSVEFEVCRPAKEDEMEDLKVVCQCEETQEFKPVESLENDRVRISELEPGVQYTVTATAHYPNQPSVSDTKTFEISKGNLTPEIVHSESQPPTCSYSITVSVTAPPQAEKYHLDNLSAKLWQISKGECQAKTIQVDQKGETATFSMLLPSTVYKAKAIATYPNKVVTSDQIEITTSSIPYCKIVLMALLILGFSVPLAFFILFQQVHVPAVTKYGLQGDTIVVSAFNSFGPASVTITECPEEGDDPHTLKAALVRKSDVVTYMANNTDTINGSATGRVSLLEDEYFLQDSFMAVNICLSSQYSPSGSSRSVIAFVFDSSDENQKFLLNETNGIDSSRYHKALQVGSTSQPICTWVNYTVASPAYYYLALGEYSLGTLAYSADLHLHEIYLNITDYEGSEHYCSSVSEMQPCTFELHDSLKQKEYVLVSYICSRPEWFSPSTHACTEFDQSAVVMIVPPTLTAILFLIIALVVAVYFINIVVILYKDVIS